MAGARNTAPVTESAFKKENSLVQTSALGRCYRIRGRCTKIIMGKEKKEDVPQDETVEQNESNKIKGKKHSRKRTKSKSRSRCLPLVFLLLSLTGVTIGTGLNAFRVFLSLLMSYMPRISTAIFWDDVVPKIIQFTTSESANNDADSTQTTGLLICIKTAYKNRDSFRHGYFTLNRAKCESEKFEQLPTENVYGK